METYRQVAEILHWLEETHRRLAGLYDACSENTENQRARLLFAHSIQGELTLAEALRRFRADASEAVLRTFFQFVPGIQEMASYLDHLETPARMTGRQAADFIGECSKQVEMTYNTLSNVSKEGTVKELLGNLAHQIAGRRNDLIEHYNRLSDM